MHGRAAPPHTSLQTVSWLFSGEIEHRDSGGVHAMVLPGQVNLMTSGYGISHSEVSTRSRAALHGVQLWVVLPDRAKDLTREFQHHEPEVWDDHPGVQARTFIGSLGASGSPVHTETPLLGSEIWLARARPGRPRSTRASSTASSSTPVTSSSMVCASTTASSGSATRASATCGCTTRPTRQPGSCCSAGNRSTRDRDVVELHRP
nr:pirin family protein [Tessaracoccus coleopterorum]